MQRSSHVGAGHLCSLFGQARPDPATARVQARIAAELALQRDLR